MTSLRRVTGRQADADIETVIDPYLNQGAAKAGAGFVEFLEATKASAASSIISDSSHV